MQMSDWDASVRARLVKQPLGAFEKPGYAGGYLLPALWRLHNLLGVLPERFQQCQLRFIVGVLLGQHL
jgi:hypothetical protein